MHWETCYICKHPFWRHDLRHGCNGRVRLMTGVYAGTYDFCCCGKTEAEQTQYWKNDLHSDESFANKYRVKLLED